QCRRYAGLPGPEGEVRTGTPGCGPCPDRAGGEDEGDGRAGAADCRPGGQQGAAEMRGLRGRLERLERAGRVQPGKPYIDWDNAWRRVEDILPDDIDWVRSLPCAHHARFLGSPARCRSGVRTVTSSNPFSVCSNTCDQTPLRRTTRSVRIACAPGFFQCIPDSFSRWLYTVLHAASVTPLPIGTPSRRHSA